MPKNIYLILQDSEYVYYQKSMQSNITTRIKLMYSDLLERHEAFLERTKFLLPR
jgi:hypothetical protein